MKTRSAAMAAALAASSLSLAAQPAQAGQDTNSVMDMPFGSIISASLAERERQRSFWSDYSEIVGRRGQNIFVDRFGSPAAFIGLTLAEERDGYAYWNAVTSSGRDASISTFKDAMREDAVSLLPRDRLEDYGRSTFGSFFGYLFIGSFGNTAEEKAPAVSASLSYNAVEARQNAVTEAEKDRPVQYGIRLWDEYAYTTIVFGHINKQPVVLHMRVKSSTDLNNFGIPVIEGNTSFVLFDDCHLVIGGSVRPTELDSKAYGPQVSVTFEHATGINKLAWYAGGAMGSDGQGFYSAGLSMPW